MTNTLTITHSEAVRLHQELTEVLKNNSLDTVQIVSTSDNIHVSVVRADNVDVFQQTTD